MEPVTTICGNCREPMPRELRFCRNCGFRLGEGSAEYTETVRFQNAPPGTVPGNSSANSSPHGFSGGPMSVSPGGQMRKRRRRMSGMTWIFVALLIFFIVGGIFSAIVKPIRDNVRVQFAQPDTRSFAGVNNFQTAEGNIGVTFGNVSAPDTPADKAGLVGGDIITMIDSKPVHSRKEMMDILEGIAIGKTVDLVYLRDGESKETKLTTISEEESDRLTEAFDNRAAGHGRFGFDDDETERVPIPGTKIFGVRLNDVSPSLPADMAGIKNGDIVITFDKTPIRTTRELNARVLRAMPYSTVNVTVIRDGQELIIPVKMGKMS